MLLELRGSTPSRTINNTKNMNKKLYTMSVAAVFAVASTAYSIPVSITYEGTTGNITFAGAGVSAGDFSFGHSGAFVVNGSEDNGFVGTIGGVYKIGTITSVGGISEASVTSLGGNIFTITDGSSHTLSATVSWMSILQVGSSGTLNDEGIVNLSSVTYTGSDPYLLSILDNPTVDTLAFTFSPSKTLQTLDNGAGGPFTTTFAGSLSTAAPDGGATAMLLGAALSAVGLLRRKLVA
jgi:hypothetical protein